LRKINDLTNLGSAPCEGTSVVDLSNIVESLGQYDTTNYFTTNVVLGLNDLATNQGRLADEMRISSSLRGFIRPGVTINVLLNDVYKAKGITDMGGVDLVDQAISNYRIAVKSKKWYFVIVTYLLDLAIANPWRLYQLGLCSSNTKKDLLAFRRAVMNEWLVDGKAYKTNRKRSQSLLYTPSNFTLHFPKKMEKQLLLL